MTPSVCTTIDALRREVAALRGAATAAAARPAIGFVPTMGALHAGHARLIEHARRECAAVVVSIFVNPLQFDRQDDLERYPRTLERDLELCGALGTDAVFAPAPGEVYPRPPMCTVEVGAIADHLCGRHRPGHFRGVATVVLKLFEMVQPDVAYFGEKDAQQLAIVRRLAADFNLPLAIVGVPTVREPDGLALSSRNVRLSPEERVIAIALYRALDSVRSRIAGGERDAAALLSHAQATIPADPRLRLEYLELVDPVDMQPVTRVEGAAVAAGALWVGGTRLIDNLHCTEPASA